jgi:hypothetical protein
VQDGTVVTCASHAAMNHTTRSASCSHAGVPFPAGGCRVVEGVLETPTPVFCSVCPSLAQSPRHSRSRRQLMPLLLRHLRPLSCKLNRSHNSSSRSPPHSHPNSNSKRSPLPSHPSRSSNHSSSRSRQLPQAAPPCPHARRASRKPSLQEHLPLQELLPLLRL